MLRNLRKSTHNIYITFKQFCTLNTTYLKSKVTFIFPPPQLAPIRKQACLEDSSCAQTRSLSSCSRGAPPPAPPAPPACSDTDSHGAPVKVHKPTMCKIRMLENI